MGKTIKEESSNSPAPGVTRLALTESEANQYHFGTEYITRLPNNIDADRLEEDRFGKWFVIEGKNLPHPFNQRNRQRLTDNLYGYLTYHDSVVRRSANPHTLFLQWDESGANVNSVTVWLKPAPVFKRGISLKELDSSDPPRPKVPPPPPLE